MRLWAPVWESDRHLYVHQANRFLSSGLRLGSKWQALYMAGSQTQSLVLLSLHPPSAVQAVVLLPFIDEPRLLRVLGPLLAKLKPHEKAENMVV